MTAQVYLSRWVTAPLIALLAAFVGLTAGIRPELAIAASLAVSFVILVIADLIWGLAAFTFIAFLEIVPFGGPALSFSKVLGLLLLISWLAVMSTQRDVTVDKRVVWPACVLLAALLGWVALSATWAEDPAIAVSTLLRFGLNAMMFVIVLTSIRERSTHTRLLAAFVAGAAVAAAYGIASPGRFESEYGRIESAALDPNELAALLVPAFSLCMFAAVGMRNRHGLRLAALFVGLLCGATIVLTVSRGGLIALAVMLCVAIVVAGRWRWRVVLVALAIASGVFIYFAGFASQAEVDHLRSTTQGDARLEEGRVTIWDVAWRMASQNPVEGVGAGNFQTSSVHYLLQPGATPRSDLIVDTPAIVHNTYLEIAAETGAVGLMLYLSFVGFCVAALGRSIAVLRRAGDREMELLARALFAGTCGLLVADFFISDEFNKALWLLLALGPAMLIVARRIGASAPEPLGSG